MRLWRAQFEASLMASLSHNKCIVLAIVELSRWQVLVALVWL